MFAVRQWPGNGADLDFRGVLEGCTAAIVAAAPIEGTLLKDGNATDEGMNNPPAKAAFLESDEYKAVAKVLPFCRLWCVRAMGTAAAFRPARLSKPPADPPRPPADDRATPTPTPARAALYHARHAAPLLHPHRAALRRTALAPGRTVPP